LLTKGLRKGPEEITDKKFETKVPRKCRKGAVISLGTTTGVGNGRGLSYRAVRRGRWPRGGKKMGQYFVSFSVYYPFANH